MNKVLIHICCGPCAIYPVKLLRDEGNTVMGYYYRHNIHPYSECRRREETLRTYADDIDLKVIYPDNYDLEAFLQMIAFRESDRCTICYHERLRATAFLAKRGKFDGFTSTLLYSKFQNHDLIRSIGESVKPTGFLLSTGISERAGRMGLKRQRLWGCTGNNTAGVFTVKKNVITNRAFGSGYFRPYR